MIKNDSVRKIVRWRIMLALFNARPMGSMDGIILQCISDSTLEVIDVDDVRAALQYLCDKGFVKVKTEKEGWSGRLTSDGVDFMEYNKEAEPGIARPKRKPVF